jgi:hypothetical protein
MTAADLLLALFDERLAALAARHELAPGETDRIRKVFRRALANPYMDEGRIYPELTGRERNGA